jgi:N-acetylglucosamine-6-phosphate deacetylase
MTPGGRRIAVRVDGDRIAAVTASRARSRGVLLGPGFVDLQVNGFAGVDFNRPDLHPADLVAVCEALLKTGTTRFLPTLITAATDRLERNLRAILAACERYPLVEAMVAGIHLEGPFLNAADGPRGAHPRRHVRPPDWAEFTRLQQAAGGRIRLLTMAPEIPGAVAFMRRATARGVVVGIGHCAPDGAALEAAVAAGALLSTHLGNGAHHLLPRHRNYLQRQLARDDLMASIICDGTHLPPYFVQNLIRAKGETNVILITDATAAAGSPPGRYSLGDATVEAGKDGVLRLAGTPYLAGSTLTMDRAVANCRHFAGVALRSAVAMATTNPARLLGGSGGRLAPGKRADMVRCRWEGRRIEIDSVYLAGRCVYAP